MQGEFYEATVYTRGALRCHENTVIENFKMTLGVIIVWGLRHCQTLLIFMLLFALHFCYAQVHVSDFPCSRNHPVFVLFLELEHSRLFYSNVGATVICFMKHCDLVNLHSMKIDLFGIESRLKA